MNKNSNNFMFFNNEHLLKKFFLLNNMTQVLKPIEIGVLSIIILIGIVALTTELTENEEVAKIIVIPSLILLILVAGYGIFKSVYVSR